MFKLCIEDDEGSQTVVPVIRDEITIGRQEGNTIRLTERNVSRRHARLIRENGAIVLEDVAARYGIKVNGEKIQKRTVFKEGDVVLIGDYRLTLRSEASAQPSSSPPPGTNGSAVAPASGPVTRPSQPRPPSSSAPAPRAAGASEGTEILPAMPAKLVIVSSNFAGQEFPLNRKEMVIGRGPDCDIIVDHRSVSQNHAKIIREKGTNYKIVDLKSRNGIRVGGEEYRAVYLKRGDVVELGHVRFRFVEPGENYVFTPSPGLDEFDEPASHDRRLSPALLGVGALIVLVAAAAVAFVLFKPDDDADAIAAADQDTGELTAIDGDPAGPGSAAAAAGPSSFTSEKIDAAIIRAKEDLEKGKIEMALGKLEAAEILEPDASQRDAIDRLAGQARAELPFKKKFRDAIEAINKKEHLEALQNLHAIPSHSLFVKLIEERELLTTARTEALEDAREALEKKDYDRTRAFVDELLSHDPEDAQALALAGELEEATDRPVAVAARNTPRDRDNGELVINGDARKRPRKTPPRSRDRLSAEEGKKIYDEAFGKLALGGDFDGAIETCKKGVSGGYVNCHRVIGMAYKKKNDTDKACKHFQTFLRHRSNDAGIQKEVEELGCP